MHRHRLVGRQRQGLAAADVEVRTVAGADDHPRLRVVLALAERPLVVGAAILDREVRPVEVIDADRDEPGRDDLHLARRKFLDRAHVELWHYVSSISSSSAKPSGSGVPFPLCNATLSVVRPRIAHLSRTGVSGIPISSSRSSFGIAATSLAFRPFTISVSIEVAACEIAQPRPENLTSSIVSPSSPKATEIVTSSPQSGFSPSAVASGDSIAPCPRGFL